MSAAPTLLQLNPYIPVYVLADTDTNLRHKWPSGEGFAIGWVDYSQEHTLLWIVAYDEGGEVWSVPNSHIRLQNNPSLQRGFKK